MRRATSAGIVQRDELDGLHWDTLLAAGIAVMGADVSSSDTVSTVYDRLTRGCKVYRDESRMAGTLADAR